VLIAADQVLKFIIWMGVVQVLAQLQKDWLATAGPSLVGDNANIACFE
jgi:hypothetical protein